MICSRKFSGPVILHIQADLSGHTTYIAVVLSLSNVFTCIAMVLSLSNVFTCKNHGYISCMTTVNQIPEDVCKQIPHLALKHVTNGLGYAQEHKTVTYLASTSYSTANQC